MYENCTPLIDNIIQEVINAEDKITQKTNNFNKLEQENKSNINNLDQDVNKNHSRIKLLNQFIKSEEEKTNKLIENREDEKNNINILLKELEDEMEKLKNIDATNSDKMEEIIINNYNEDLKNLEKVLEKNEEKRKKIEKELKDCTMSKSQLMENLMMLKQEKHDADLQIVNLISQKESLEEILDLNNFSFFKNLNMVGVGQKSFNNKNKIYLKSSNIDTLEMSTNTMRSIELYYQEIILLDKNKIIQSLYENLNDIFMYEESTRYGSKLKKTFNIDKCLFDNLLKRSLINYKEGEGLFNTDDFFLILTKKIYDLLQTTNDVKNPNSIINDINIEKFRIYFKYFFKIQYYDYVISNKICFINRDYKLIKKEKKGIVNDINISINNLLSKLDKIENKDNEIRLKIDTLLESKSKSKSEVKLNSLKQVDNKLASVIEMKNQLSVDIICIKNKTKNRIKSMEDQIKEIVTINQELNKRKENLEKEIETKKFELNEEIMPIRNYIADKFKEIKRHFSPERRNGENSGAREKEVYNKNLKRFSQSKHDLNQANDYENPKLSAYEFILKYMKKINKTLEENNFKKIIITPERNKMDSYIILDNDENEEKSKTPTSLCKNLLEKMEKNLDNKSDINDDDRGADKNSIKVRVQKYRETRPSSIEQNSTNFNTIYNPQLNYTSRLAFLKDGLTSNGDGKSPDHTHRSDFGEKSRSDINSHSRSVSKNQDQLLRDYVKKIKSEVNKSIISYITNEDEGKKFAKIIHPILISTNCYMRKTFSNNKKTFPEFDPLSFESNYNLELLKFYKTSIFLDPSNQSLRLNNDDLIKLDEIEKTIVTKNIKNIINIHQIYKKLKNEKIDPEKFFQSEEYKSDIFSSEIRRRCLINKFFYFTIQLLPGIRIELILLSFDDFKNWLNGLACIIKNKSNIDIILNNFIKNK